MAPTNLFVPGTPHECRPAGPLKDAAPTEARPAAGVGPRRPPSGGQTVLADRMMRAIAREGGAVGRYDVARRLYREKEGELLTRVARGSARAHAELDSLRRGPLYFPASRYEGAVDFGGGVPSHAMRPDGDFVLGVSNTGDDLASHPAVHGMVPRVTVRSKESARAQQAPKGPSRRDEVWEQKRRRHEERTRQQRDRQPGSRRREEREPEAGAGESSSRRRGAGRNEHRTRERRRSAPMETPVASGSGAGPTASQGHGQRRRHDGATRSSRRSAARRAAVGPSGSSPFIGAGVGQRVAEERPRTAGMPAGVWNGGGQLNDAERAMLAGCIEASTISGQRQQVDELTLETSRALPAGWAKLRSRSQPGTAYYHCKMSGASQWQRPESRDGTDGVPEAKAEGARAERAAPERATSTSSTTEGRRARHAERSRQRRERRERRRRGT